MATTTLSNVTRRPANMSTTKALPQNASTTVSVHNGGPSDDDSHGIYLWMPLIFVLAFSLIVITMIVLSRFSFRCCRCCRSNQRRTSLGKSRELFLRFFSVANSLLVGRSLFQFSCQNNNCRTAAGRTLDILSLTAEMNSFVKEQDHWNSEIYD